MTAHAVEALKPFEEACEDLYSSARTAAGNGAKIAGFMCSYSPQELFHAAGYLPVRILGRPGGTPRADELLQTYACSFARSTLDSALTSELDFMDVAVFSHTCDTMQNLADLWRSYQKDMPTFIVSVPALLSGAPSRTYFRKELDRVREELEKVAGPISDETLLVSMQLYERHRQKMQQLYALRRQRPDLLSGQQMMAVVVSSLLMDKAEHLGLLEALIGAIEGEEDVSKNQPRVFVTGSVCQNLDFLGAIEDAGCTVIDDDLCMGSRTYTLSLAEGQDPMDALCDMYLDRLPCPAFHKPGFDPGDHLVARAKEGQADGVVFLLTKFCDPWGFDYPHVNKKLEEAGIPTLMLEVEQHLPTPAQFRTRAEAFIEMLESKALS